MKKKILIIALVCILAGVAAFYIVKVNKMYPQGSVTEYELNESVELNGYSASVSSYKVMSIEDFLNEYGIDKRKDISDEQDDLYVMVDGDDTYPANQVREMVNKVLDRQVDMVVGDRLSSTYFEENKRPFHNLGNSLVRGSINTLFKNDIKDIMTGYRAFSYRFVKTFPVLSKGFEIETEMSIHAIDKNMFVENVVIEYKDRPEGSESKHTK